MTLRQRVEEGIARARQTGAAEITGLLLVQHWLNDPDPITRTRSRKGADKWLVPHDNIPRETREIVCPECLKGGAISVMDRVETTRDELKQFNCTRSYECCARAFVCTVCKYRHAQKVDAPEAE